MKVILDTNILLVSISPKSKFRPIFDQLLAGGFDLVISNDILSEYLEIIGEKASPTVAANVAELLLNLSHVHLVNVFYNWNLIVHDSSDNKFVDAALAGGCDYLVTNDKHFKVVQDNDFPKVQIISTIKFMELIIKSK